MIRNFQIKSRKVGHDGSEPIVTWSLKEIPSEAGEYDVVSICGKDLTNCCQVYRIIETNRRIGLLRVVTSLHPYSSRSHQEYFSLVHRRITPTSFMWNVTTAELDNPHSELPIIVVEKGFHLIHETDRYLIQTKSTSLGCIFKTQNQPYAHIQS